MDHSTAKAAPRKLQESASFIIKKNMTPLIKRCMSVKQMLLPSAETDRGNQQTANLKWQQDMFLRILTLRCLVQEGLADRAELDDMGKAILSSITTPHPDGEWNDFTRDKLLFIQDLFQSRCITEADYHSAKGPLLTRLAEQGAQLDTEDFKLLITLPKVVSRSPTKVVVIKPANASPVKGELAVPRKTPIKQMMEAMSRLKCTSGKGSCSQEDKPSRDQNRVPHAFDFIRPPDCPTREAPVPFTVKFSDGPLESPLFHDPYEAASVGVFAHDSQEFVIDTETPLSPPVSPGETVAKPSATSLTARNPTNMTPPKWTPSARAINAYQSNTRLSNEESPVSASRGLPVSSSSPTLSRGSSISEIKRQFSVLVRKFRGESTKPEVSSDDEDTASDEGEQEQPTPAKSVWQRLDLLRNSPKKKPADDDFGIEDDGKDPLLKALDEYPAHKVSRGAGLHGQGPNTARLKKKIPVRAAPTNFFIDKVLGDNIKTELARIRMEMNRSNPGNQAFTNDQIDAIATRLPVDKRELMRFFPQSWCDRYGDVVLEVVHKEFKCHVSEMDGLRKKTTNTNREKSRKEFVDFGDEYFSTFQTDSPKPQSNIPESQSTTPTPEKQQQYRVRDSGNDENRSGNLSNNNAYPKPPYVKHSPSSGATRPSPSPSPNKPSISRCFTTEGSTTNTPTFHKSNLCSLNEQVSSNSPLTPRRVRRGLGFDTDLDGKLVAEIQRMPLKSFNECGSMR